MPNQISIQMNIPTEIRENILVVLPEGNLSKLAARDLGELLKTESSEGFHHIVIDCRELVNISSDGLRVILHSFKQMKAAGGNLVVSSLRNQVASALEVTGMLKIIESFSDIDTAVFFLKSNIDSLEKEKE